MHDFHCHLGGAVSLEFIRQRAPSALYERAKAAADKARRGLPLSAFLRDWFQVVEHLQSDLGFLRDSAEAARAAFLADSPRGHFELRFCPFLREADPVAQIEAVREGLEAAGGGRSGGYRLLLIAVRGNVDHLDKIHGLLRRTGVDGVDVAGPENDAEHCRDWLDEVCRTYSEARRRGLMTTYHTGEARIENTLALLRSSVPLVRIGHGVALRRYLPGDRPLPTFELCPAVNSITRVATFDEVLDFARLLDSRGYAFVFGSDNPAVSGMSWKQQWDLVPQTLQRSALRHGARLLPGHPEALTGAVDSRNESPEHLTSSAHLT